MQGDFDYLADNAIYFDAACQSLRPRPVQNALLDYYQHFNSCGERVKYDWGEKTDDLVTATRRQVLDYFHLKPREYFVAFTQNTTYGLNLLLTSLTAKFDQVITSDIEHNSPFLSTIKYASTQQTPRVVLERQPDGTLSEDSNFQNALVVLGAVSNIDGRRLENLTRIVKLVHKQGGVIIIDAAQAAAHEAKLLHQTDADAICFSAHKMYAPSLGVMIVKKSLLPHLQPAFLGGGMVDDVTQDQYELSASNPDHTPSIFEPGLQSFGEIIALGAALKWLPQQNPEALHALSQELFDFLQASPKVHLINQTASPVISFYLDGLDSHLLGKALADAGIMVRTGYFCCHYYLDHKMHYPPLVRFSLGYHNRPADLVAVKSALEKVL